MKKVTVEIYVEGDNSQAAELAIELFEVPEVRFAHIKSVEDFAGDEREFVKQMAADGVHAANVMSIDDLKPQS